MWYDESFGRSMKNDFYVPEYAQQLEQDKLAANLEQELELCAFDEEKVPDELSDEELEQIVIELEQTMSLLSEKSETIRSQQRKVKSKLDRLYLSALLRERILKRRRIEDMDFSVRVFDLLIKSGISTVYELCSKSPNEVYLILRRNKNLLSEVEDKLNEKRLRLYGADGEENADVVDNSEKELQLELKRKFDKLFGTSDE